MNHYKNLDPLKKPFTLVFIGKGTLMPIGSNEKS